MDEKVILLVEDNYKDVLLLIRAFKKNNINNRIDVVRDGQRALDYLFSEEGVLPAMVILDLKLPKLDGHEVLRQIRSNERTKQLPVVILSSSDDYKDIDKAYAAGVNSFVSKPVNIDDFTTTVRDLGLYWLQINKTAH